MGKLKQKWFWIDKNCFNQENSALFETLKLLKMDVKRYSNFQAFWTEFVEISKNDISIVGNVICSATL